MQAKPTPKRGPACSSNPGDSSEREREGGGEREIRPGKTAS